MYRISESNNNIVFAFMTVIHLKKKKKVKKPKLKNLKLKNLNV